MMVPEVWQPLQPLGSGSKQSVLKRAARQNPEWLTTIGGAKAVPPWNAQPPAAEDVRGF
jgi:succinylarginine dihydrolase